MLNRHCYCCCNLTNIRAYNVYIPTVNIYISFIQTQEVTNQIYDNLSYLNNLGPIYIYSAIHFFYSSTA